MLPFDIEDGPRKSPRSSHSASLPDFRDHQSMTFEPLLKLKHLSIDPGLEELEPFVEMSQHLKQKVTRFRVTLVLLCLFFSALGVTLVPSDHFRFLVSIDDIASYSDCVKYCSSASSEDGEDDWPSGAQPLCKDEDGISTVVYQECYGHKFAECHRVCAVCEERQALPKDEIVRTLCKFPLVPAIWMPYVTVSVFVVTIAFVIEGHQPELLLPGAAAFLSVLGVITAEEVVAGFSNGGVVSLAVLFPISEALTETGVLEMVVGMLLGEPKSLWSALLRMMFPVALVSAFLSNTATVSMMIPIIVSWAKRLAVHPGKMLMPLSFAAQLGGCLTLLGGSQCLVAKASIPASIYQMGFFDLFPIGCCNLIATTAIITVLATTGFLKSSEAEADTGQQTGMHSQPMSDVYKLLVCVKGNKFGSLHGRALSESGLDRLDGVFNVRHCSCEKDVLERNDKLEAECDASGVVSLRHHPGLVLGNHTDVAKLGVGRHRRSLYEASLCANSKLLQESIDWYGNHCPLWQQPEFLRESLGACLISVKVPPGKLQGHVQASSVLLLEADYRFMRKFAENWADFFSVVRQVPGSSPPRGDLHVDRLRNIVICAGMAFLIGLLTIGVIKLYIGGILFLVVLLFTKALTPAQLFASIKIKVLLTIIGALALGTALEKVGIVTYIAGWLTIAQGTVAVIAIIYCISVLLSMFINNTATIAILAPMLISIVQEDPSLRLEPLVWALVYGAGSCFTTPLGYQTNMMVMPDGEYSFGDFMRFGSVVQLFHLVFTVAFTCVLSPYLV